MPNSRPAAILKQRCPACKEGETYKSAWKMHETCPVCGIRYERESGYFLIAMFFAYVMGAVVLAPLGLALYPLSRLGLLDDRRLYRGRLHRLLARLPLQPHPLDASG